MSHTIERLTAADFPDMIDLLDLVFSKAHGATDFVSLIPSIYQPTDWHCGHNYAIRIDGGIRAVLGLFPLDWRPGGEALAMAGIGGVACHPRYRGHSLMRELMAAAMAAQAADGVAIGYLAGQRQRYGYFGYETAGTLATYQLNAASLKHAYGAAPALRFRAADGTAAGELERLRGWHAGLPLRCERRAADWPGFLVSWRHGGWIATDADGRDLGYVIASADGSVVAECLAESDADAVAVLRALYAARQPAAMDVYASGITAGTARLLGETATAVSARHSGNWRIFDWPAVLGRLLGLRAANAILPSGRVCLEVTGEGTYELVVDGRAATVAETDAEPALRLEPLTATRLIFGPQRPSAQRELPAAAALLDAWCPLPLAIPKQDTV